MHVTARHPHGSWRGPAPTWRSRWPKDANGDPVAVPPCPPQMRANFARFTTTPAWAGVAAQQQSAHNLFRSRRTA
jgi:hypothetical protein